jgi:hypothetical protein
MVKNTGGKMGGKEWRRWIVVGWLWIPNFMAGAKCCRKMNPKPTMAMVFFFLLALFI